MRLTSLYGLLGSYSGMEIRMSLGDTETDSNIDVTQVIYRGCCSGGSIATSLEW